MRFEPGPISERLGDRGPSAFRRRRLDPPTPGAVRNDEGECRSGPLFPMPPGDARNQFPRPARFVRPRGEANSGFLQRPDECAFPSRPTAHGGAGSNVANAPFRRVPRRAWPRQIESAHAWGLPSGYAPTPIRSPSSAAISPAPSPRASKVNWRWKAKSVPSEFLKFETASPSAGMGLAARPTSLNGTARSWGA